ncbi:hypothetical protein D5F01_LYC00130 [Larimichthys crocea]|uniref:Uncharacterized protein n=1 Tax=Larimichthys crocea TaxID=215358 RepID=A0A6G0J892_LARCR|nr:hypothetical protein D5F01_LYC00130 [Larimichthys crocea]
MEDEQEVQLLFNATTDCTGKKGDLYLTPPHPPPSSPSSSSSPLSLILLTLLILLTPPLPPLPLPPGDLGHLLRAGLTCQGAADGDRERIEVKKGRVRVTVHPVCTEEVMESRGLKSLLFTTLVVTLRGTEPEAPAKPEPYIRAGIGQVVRLSVPGRAMLCRARKEADSLYERV